MVTLLGLYALLGLAGCYVSHTAPEACPDDAAAEDGPGDPPPETRPDVTFDSDSFEGCGESHPVVSVPGLVATQVGPAIPGAVRHRQQMAWSEDGRHLFVPSSPGVSGSRDVYVVDVTAPCVAPIAQIRIPTTSYEGLADLAVSPDEANVAVLQFGPSERERFIQIYRMDGTSYTRAERLALPDSLGPYGGEVGQRIAMGGRTLFYADPWTARLLAFTESGGHYGEAAEFLAHITSCCPTSFGGPLDATPDGSRIAVADRALHLFRFVDGSALAEESGVVFGLSYGREVTMSDDGLLQVVAASTAGPRAPMLFISESTTSHQLGLRNDSSSDWSTVGLAMDRNGAVVALTILAIPRTDPGTWSFLVVVGSVVEGAFEIDWTAQVGAENELCSVQATVSPNGQIVVAVTPGTLGLCPDSSFQLYAISDER